MKIQDPTGYNWELTTGYRRYSYEASENQAYVFMTVFFQHIIGHAIYANNDDWRNFFILGSAFDSIHGGAIYSKTYYGGNLTFIIATTCFTEVSSNESGQAVLFMNPNPEPELCYSLMETGSPLVSPYRIPQMGVMGLCTVCNCNGNQDTVFLFTPKLDLFGICNFSNNNEANHGSGFTFGRPYICKVVDSNLYGYVDYGSIFSNLTSSNSNFIYRRGSFAHYKSNFINIRTTDNSGNAFLADQGGYVVMTQCSLLRFSHPVHFVSEGLSSPKGFQFFDCVIDQNASDLDGFEYGTDMQPTEYDPAWGDMDVTFIGCKPIIVDNMGGGVIPGMVMFHNYASAVNGPLNEQNPRFQELPDPDKATFVQHTVHFYTYEGRQKINRTFTYSTVIIDHCMMYKFFASSGIAHLGQGGAVFGRECEILMRDSWSIGNNAECGGLLATYDSTVKIENCTFFGDNARFQGGSLMIVEDKRETMVWISRTKIWMSKSDEFGGAGAFSGISDLLIENSTFGICHARHSGGALQIHNTVAFFRGSRFISNRCGEELFKPIDLMKRIIKFTNIDISHATILEEDSQLIDDIASKTLLDIQDSGAAKPNYISQTYQSIEYAEIQKTVQNIKPVIQSIFSILECTMDLNIKKTVTSQIVTMSVYKSTSNSYCSTNLYSYCTESLFGYETARRKLGIAKGGGAIIATSDDSTSEWWKSQSHSEIVSENSCYWANEVLDMFSEKPYVNQLLETFENPGYGSYQAALPREQPTLKGADILLGGSISFRSYNDGYSYTKETSIGISDNYKKVDAVPIIYIEGEERNNSKAYYRCGLNVLDPNILPTSEGAEPSLDHHPWYWHNEPRTYIPTAEIVFQEDKTYLDIEATVVPEKTKVPTTPMTPLRQYTMTEEKTYTLIMTEYTRITNGPTPGPETPTIEETETINETQEETPTKIPTRSQFPDGAVPVVSYSPSLSQLLTYSISETASLTYTETLSNIAKPGSSPYITRVGFTTLVAKSFYFPTLTASEVYEEQIVISFVPEDDSTDGI